MIQSEWNCFGIVMSEEFSKLNKTIASFMLTSLAISGSAFAMANENLIADAMGGMITPTAVNITNELYGIPTAPPVMALYAPPTAPSVNSVNIEESKQHMYNIPAKDTGSIQNNFNKIRQVNKDEDSKRSLPVNYVAPVIIPGYYIQDSK